MINEDYMIIVDNVSMKFNLQIEKDFSIKQAFVKEKAEPAAQVG